MNKRVYIYRLIVSLAAVLVLTAFNSSNRVFAVKSNDAGFVIGFKTVDRRVVLEQFFDRYNSPLKNSSERFVEVADKYKLDYRILPSIACMESTCGKFLISGTYNPFGWGGGLIGFNSYDEAIEAVGKGLNEIYISRGFDTPELMAPIYTPPNHYNWLKGVNYFSDQIDELALK